MPTLNEIISDSEMVLAMQPEELAGPLLVELCERIRHRQKPSLYNFALAFSQHSDEVRNAIAEAWAWLQREGCLAPDWSQVSSGFEIVTRRGYELAKGFDGQSSISGELLVKNLLHPLIRQGSWPAFVRRQFDSAVFEAVKQVEVSVRAGGGFSPTNIGVNLMRLAFAPENGQLTDSTLPKAEQEGLQQLFAGAIGYYKNSQSHRKVPVSETEAIDVMIISSHLLRIVDARVSQPSP